MTDDRNRPTLAGFVLPAPGRVIWTTVVVSALSYLVLGRAVANLVAIVGGVLVTIVLVKVERSG